MDGTVKRFRRKPTEINAVMWTGENRKNVEKFGAPVLGRNGRLELYVAANKTWLPLEIGEYIAKDFLGYYPIKAEAIKQNYDEIISKKAVRK
jgi:hypothetical protein